MINLFFRITNRLFAFFMDYLGRWLRDSHRLDLNNTVRKRLLVVRQGGFGDLLFISAVIAELKKQHPFLSIDLMCHPQYQGAFHRTAAIDRLIDHRWPSLPTLFEYDYFVFLDGVVECDPDANTVNIYDLFSEKYFGVALSEKAKKPSLAQDPALPSQFFRQIPALRDKTLHIGLQLFANSPVRTPSLNFWQRLITGLLRKFPEATIILLAEAGRASEAASLAAALNDECAKTRVISAAGVTADVAQLTTLVSMMDAVVAPDSSVIHISAAFHLPAIGVYGPFPSSLRIRSYGHAIALDTQAACAPCFTHGHWPCKVAREAGIVNSPCFDEISDTNIEIAIGSLALKLDRVNLVETSPQLPCPICTGGSSKLDVVDFNKSCEEQAGQYLKLSGKPIYYSLCTECGFCFAPEICAWSADEFKQRIYNDAYPLVDPDFARTRSEDNSKRIIELLGMNVGFTHLDFGGGNGRLSTLMAQHGWNSRSYDPYLANSELPSLKMKFDLITAFEVFEHAPDPHKMFAQLASLTNDRGLIIASTLLSDGQIHRHQRIDWWYAAPRNGHISLFSARSLQILAETHGFNTRNLSSSLHLFWRGEFPSWARPAFQK